MCRLLSRGALLQQPPPKSPEHPPLAPQWDRDPDPQATHILGVDDIMGAALPQHRGLYEPLHLLVQQFRFCRF